MTKTLFLLSVICLMFLAQRSYQPSPKTSDLPIYVSQSWYLHQTMLQESIPYQSSSGSSIPMIEQCSRYAQEYISSIFLYSFHLISWTSNSLFISSPGALQHHDFSRLRERPSDLHPPIQPARSRKQNRDCDQVRTLIVGWYYTIHRGQFRE